MNKILGLDLGTNSIGWAIREINQELHNQIIDKGVMTFEKGVAVDKSGEHPKVQKRTESRSKRRNYQAEKYRKWSLLACLIKNNMCPLSIEELNEWRYFTKGIGRKYPQSVKFIQWLRFDFDGDGKPDFERLGYTKHESYYLFRKLIVDEKKIDIFSKEPHIIGRVLYQLGQRRGYYDLTDLEESEQKELTTTIMSGSKESGASGVDEIKPYIEKHKTLGAALYLLQKEKNARIRKRYNLRSDFENELKEICRIQKLDNIYNLLWSAIIWQRPLRSQKGLVGVCTFENNKPRCPISHPLYEEYRTWVFINNLKIKPVIPIEDSSKAKNDLENVLNDVVYPLFYRASDFKLSIIKKELVKHGFQISAYFPEDTKVLNCNFLYAMQQLFYEDWSERLGWKAVLDNKLKPKQCRYNIEDLWHLHFTKTTNKKTGQVPFEILKDFAKYKLSLPDDKAEKFAKIKLQQGYATLSVNAIKKILPYLKKGFIYSEAIYLANLPKVMNNKNLNEGDIEIFAETIHEIIKRHRYEQRIVAVYNNLVTDYFEDRNILEANKTDLIETHLRENYGEKSWSSFPIEIQSNIISDVETKLATFLNAPKHKPESHYLKPGRLHDKIFSELMNDYGLPPENIKYLWHPSEQDIYLPAKTIYGKKYLGSPEPISKGFKNPMALKTLYKLKKLINYLIEVGKIDEQTRIVVETARELNNANMRKAIEIWQRERERENDIFKKKIGEINVENKSNYDVNDKNLIGKIRLWYEQKHICVYTGKTINLTDLMDGSKYDFEHTVPVSMSFDNEFKNLTIADKTYNQQIKGKRLPSECPNFENDYNGYPAILNTLQTLFGRIYMDQKIIKGKKSIIFRCQKIEDLENMYREWKNKHSDDKEIKDKIIIKRHCIRMELDYWRSKFQSFTIKEYKAGWRNSQLRDTQTITKYTLPYLRTVFDKVEPQKGTVTSTFRKIFNIQPRIEKKDRSTHSHHAIDAAVLTLIPPAVIRDKFLKDYYEAVDNGIGNSYHRSPLRWNKFHSNHILDLENDLLINFQPEFRTLTPSIKKIRKRGKVQYLKYKDQNGKLHFKLNSDGKKIPLIAKGDSIRGQLHKEFIYGAILKPKFNEYEKAISKAGIFLHEARPSFVKRVHLEIDSLSGFKSVKADPENKKFLNQFEEIVDPRVRKLVLSFVKKELNIGVSPNEVFNKPVWMLDRNGNKVNRIRRVRVFQGNITPPEIKKIEEAYLSKHEHKQFTYADNTDYVSMACYFGKDSNFNSKYHFKPFTALALAKSKSIPKTETQDGIYYSLLWELKPGMKVMIKKTIDEDLKSISKYELTGRIYKVNTVYPAYQGPYEYFYADLNYHLIIVSPDIKLPKRGKNINFENPKNNPLVRLNLAKTYILIEGNHFEIKPDGDIKWIF